MTRKPLVFDVPWSALCSDNRKYVARYILSKQYRQAKAEVQAAAMRAADKARWKLYDDSLSLVVVVREPNRRRRDFNYQKALMDAITESGVVWQDDSQVRQMLWTFTGVDKLNPGATITITPYYTPSPP